MFVEGLISYLLYQCAVISYVPCVCVLIYLFLSYEFRNMYARGRAVGLCSHLSQETKKVCRKL